MRCKEDRAAQAKSSAHEGILSDYGSGPLWRYGYDAGRHSNALGRRLRAEVALHSARAAQLLMRQHAVTWFKGVANCKEMVYLRQPVFCKKQ